LFFFCGSNVCKNAPQYYVKRKLPHFDALLIAYLSIFILVINQQFISCLYMFQASCAHRQEVKIVLYSL